MRYLAPGCDARVTSADSQTGHDGWSVVRRLAEMATSGITGHLSERCMMTRHKVTSTLSEMRIWGCDEMINRQPSPIVI